MSLFYPNISFVLVEDPLWWVFLDFYLLFNFCLWPDLSYLDVDLFLGCNEEDTS
jgi:hypothetical protein